MTAPLFTFPNPVDEVSARLVAGGVVALCAATVLLDAPWLTVVIAYGFVARVLAGPRFSPLGLLVTRVIRPRLRVPAKLVAGPPKRFAQGIGATLSITATVLAVCLDHRGAAYAVLAAVVVAATLESVFGYCLGCVIFSRLMRLGLIPESACEACNDITGRLGRP